MAKLVRDYIPRFARGKTFTNLNDRDSYRKALLDKLVEEAEEVRESDGDVEEIADVMEVMEALIHEFGHNTRHVESVKRQKREDRGGFLHGVYMVD